MDVERLEGMAARYVDEGRVLGLALALIAGGEVVSLRGFGRTSAEDEGVPVTPATLFDIASIAKVLLAALILRLVERGTVALDEPVLAYLPGYAFSDPGRGRRVTLRHLLSHASGLPAAGKGWGPPGRDALGAFCREQLARHAFLADPGVVHLYSNTAICLAGYVAEAATGRPYRELVREFVLDPLAMDRATFDRAVAMTYRLALPHETGEDGRPRTLHRWEDNASGEPSGFALAPVRDLANLALVHLNRGRFGGERFLAPETIALAHTAQGDRRVAEASDPFAHLWESHGLGLMLGRYCGARVVQHGGVSQGFNNFFHLLPDRRAGFVLLSNHGDDRSLVELVFAIHDELLGAAPRGAAPRTVPRAAAVAAPDRRAWADHAGTYLNVQHGRLLTVAASADALVLQRPDGPRRLVPLAAGQYSYEEPGAAGRRVPVAFVPEGGQPAAHLVVGGTPYHRLDPGAIGEPDPGAWPRFAGTYRDPSNLGVGAVWRIVAADHVLRIVGDWADEDCMPLGATSFLSSVGLLEFDPAEQVLTIGKATRYHKSEGLP